MKSACPEDATLGETVELFLSAIIATVSFSLYALEIRLIARQPNLQHPFFFQFILLAISKILLWLAEYISTRVLPYPGFCNLFFPKFSESSTALKSLLYGFYIPLTTQMFTIIIICISRMTVVLYPIKASKIWARYSYHTLAGITICGVFFWFFLYNWDALVILMDFGEEKRLFLVFAGDWPDVPLTFIVTILCIPTLLIVIITTTVTLSKLYHYNGSKAKAEVNLFWTSMCFVLTTILIAFYTIMTTIFYYTLHDKEMTLLILSWKGWIFDVNCCLPAWLLVFTNKQIKKELLGTKNKIPFVTKNSLRVHSR